ncbi:MAG TPA: GntR family transcriptional regulator [Vicinamibacterales bacterium]|nr:GntR family transcriptional regulator [Vicinamibacterales bacterium]
MTLRLASRALAGDRRHVTKQRYVYSTLRAAILRCEMAPGERLVIDDLARSLDISIIPVREALRMLESEGLVVNIAHVGATVAPVSRQSIVEVFTILEGLETVSARAAAGCACDADIAVLDETVTAMDRALEAGRQDAWAELNTRFHLEISHLSSMPMLHQMLQRALDHWDRVRRHFFSGVFTHRAETAQREHHEIVENVRMRRIDDLERIMRAHNRGALAAYTAYLDASEAQRDGESHP